MYGGVSMRGRNGALQEVGMHGIECHDYSDLNSDEPLQCTTSGQSSNWAGIEGQKWPQDRGVANHSRWEEKRASTKNTKNKGLVPIIIPFPSGAHDPPTLTPQAAWTRGFAAFASQNMNTYSAGKYTCKSNVILPSVSYLLSLHIRVCTLLTVTHRSKGSRGIAMLAMSKLPDSSTNPRHA